MNQQQHQAAQHVPVIFVSGYGMYCTEEAENMRISVRELMKDDSYIAG